MSSHSTALESPTLPVVPIGAAQRRPAPPRRGRLWRQFSSALGWRVTSGASDVDPHAANAALVACLADLPAPETRALRQLLMHTRSLAELWHLRPEVFRVLSLHHSQTEAQRRLAALNPLFERR
ncbi:MAG: hypothetical protein V4792_13560 [Pseudomonadota bacterium]